MAPTSSVDPDLDPLLARCHPGELTDLSTLLRVAPAPGADWAAILAKTLRRSGGHLLANATFRSGDGPPWREAVAELLGRLGSTSSGDVEEDERSVAALAAEASGPDVALPAGWRFAPAVAAVLVTGPLLGPLWMALASYWLGRPDDGRFTAAVVAVAGLRASLRHRVTIGVMGPPSAGKDAALRALFGVDTGNVSPVAGSTRRAEVWRLPDTPATFVVNAPGLGDVDEGVTEEARRAIACIDVFLFVVSAQGGIQQRERDEFARIRALGRPTLVIVNKVDTLAPAHRMRFIAASATALDWSEQGIIAAAFDPLPALSPTPLGVSDVRTWIESALTSADKAIDGLPWRSP